MTYKQVIETPYCYIHSVCLYYASNTALSYIPLPPLLPYHHPGIHAYIGQHGEQDYGCIFSYPVASVQIKPCPVIHSTVKNTV